MGDHKAKTVIILGAGASHEFGLPVGATLMEQISEYLSEDNIRSPLQNLTEVESIFRKYAKEETHTYGAYWFHETWPTVPAKADWAFFQNWL